MGIMSSKRMPGVGKLGHWRKADRSVNVRLESSEELEEEAAGILLLAPSGEVVGSTDEGGG
jgi:hypothetical protein